MIEPSDCDLVVLTDALQDIVDQADYYIQKSGTQLASRWDAAVEASILSLLSMPHRGSPANLHSPGLSDLRRIPVRGFDQLWVFYRADLEERVVIVVGVLHMAQDIARILATPRG